MLNINSGILDVAIGLLWIFLLTSLLVSWLKELIINWLKLRSEHMANVVQNLLAPGVEKLDGLQKLAVHWQEGDDIARRMQENFTKLFYEHPIISSLSAPATENRGRPSYIGARDFANTLFDLFINAGGKEPTEVEKVLEQIEAGAANIGDRVAREAIISLINNAKYRFEKSEEQVAAFRENLQNWFNSTMDRSEGWFKRRVHKIGFWVALVITVALNVDTVGLAKALWQDAQLRELISNSAVEYLAQDEEQKAEEAFEQLEELGLPIFWSFDMTDPAQPFDPRDWPGDLLGWLEKGFGLLITAFAVTFGSPIWHDLLGQLVNMRLAGKKPSTSTA